jgi:hypothetical protein
LTYLLHFALKLHKFKENNHNNNCLILK